MPWFVTCVQNKDGTNLEFHWNWIKYPGNFEYEYRMKYEYSVASNSFRILNGVEMFCRDAASSHGHGHKSVPESSALWPYVSIFLFTFWPWKRLLTAAKVILSYLMYIYTRLQKIIYISVKNKNKKTNSRKTQLDLRGYTDNGAYYNISNVSQASLNKWPSQIPVLC